MRKTGLLALGLLTSIILNAQTIITIAGGSHHTVALGDGGPATSAFLVQPYGLASDKMGNLFIADDNHSRVRKVDTFGIITTAAGNGQGFYSGDGSQATSSNVSVSGPTGLAIDHAGNLYIACGGDADSNGIRKIAPDGIITTYAGGIGGGGTTGGDGGPASAAEFVNLGGLAVDGKGNLFAADGDGYVIRRIDGTTGIITTYAGIGPDSSGGSGGPSNGDGGPATVAILNDPNFIAADATGNLYVSADDIYEVRKIDTNGIITRFAGNGTHVSFSGDGGPATAAVITGVGGVATDKYGNVYIAGDSRIRKVDTAGIINTIAGNGSPTISGDGGLATAAGLGEAYNVYVDSEMNIYVMNQSPYAIVRKILPYIIPVTVNMVQGVNGQWEEMQVYPNPSATGRYMIAIPTAVTETVYITVTDVAGRVVASRSATTNAESSIQVATPGTYIITATTPHNKWVTKVVYSP
jgi:trimeric autotransporter adhesin